MTPIKTRGADNIQGSAVNAHFYHPIIDVCVDTEKTRTVRNKNKMAVVPGIEPRDHWVISQPSYQRKSFSQPVAWHRSCLKSSGHQANPIKPPSWKTFRRKFLSSVKINQQGSSWVTNVLSRIKKSKWESLLKRGMHKRMLKMKKRLKGKHEEQQSGINQGDEPSQVALDNFLYSLWLSLLCH